ncbi:MAG: hypothetical protein JWQ16_649, partial [Novosphingobium sp.]|nr:hypothetical protein [Novosphingobium sp.]
SRYLIGSHCGPKYYDLSFAQARRQHNDLKQRQGLIARMDAFAAASSGIFATLRALLQSEGLRMLDLTRSQLKKYGGDAYVRLHAIALRNGMLTEPIRVRDYAAESARPAHANGGRTLYRFEDHVVGPLEGVAVLIEHGDCRDHVLALKGALEQLANLQRHGTDAVSTGAFVKKMRSCDEALEQAVAAIARARHAPAFFSSANLERLERWSGQFSSFSLRARDGDLEVVLSERLPICIPKLSAVILPDLPRP